MNTRLDAAVIAFQLDHADAKVVICDREFAPVMRAALARAQVKPLIVDYEDREFLEAGDRLSDLDYEALIDEGDPGFRWRMTYLAFRETIDLWTWVGAFIIFVSALYITRREAKLARERAKVRAREATELGAP